MAKKRMAGEALNEDTAVSAAASEAVADSERNKTLGERFGQDFVDRVKVDGNQDGNKYSRKELASEFRYGRGDTSVDDTVAKFQSMVDSGKFNGNNKAQGFLEMHGVKFGNGGDKEPTASPAQPEKEPTYSIQPVPNEEKPDVMFPSATGPGGPQSVYQDNDINSSVNGNDNNVNIDQDNSVRQYGGTNKKAEMGATNLMDNYVLNLRKSRQAG